MAYDNFENTSFDLNHDGHTAFFSRFYYVTEVNFEEE